jgi:hypothetical protein
MAKRFVITEFFRTPDAESPSIRVWYHKNTDVVKRELIIGNRYFCDKFYNKDGKLHNDNGEPALITSEGEKHFYLNGQRHNGQFEPAVIRPDGSKEYWVYGDLRSKTQSLNPRFIDIFATNILTYEQIEHLI